MLRILILLLMIARAVAADPEYEVKPIGDLRMADIVKVSYAHISSSERGDFIGQKVSSEWQELRPAYYKELHDLLVDPKSYNDVRVFCFEPGFALKIEDKDAKYEVAICMACDQVSILKDGNILYHSSINEPLLRYFKALYFDCYILNKEVSGDLQK